VSSFSHPSPSSAGDGSRRPSGERKRAVVGYRHVASGSAVGAVYDVTFRGGLVAIAIDKGFIVADPLQYVDLDALLHDRKSVEADRHPSSLAPRQPDR